MKRALITGIAGFCGGYLARYLLDRNVRVYGLDVRSEISPPHEHLRSELVVARLDLLDRHRVELLVKKVQPDFIFHLAAISQGKDLARMLQVNVVGTENILDAALLVGAKVLVPGSAAEYGLVAENDVPISEETVPRPITFYGIAKLAQTMLGQKHYLNTGAPVYLSRAFNIIGPGQPPTFVCSALAHQVKNILQGNAKAVLQVGNLSPKRDFVDVRDVVRAYWLIITRGQPGEIYNICSGRGYTIKDVVHLLLRIAGLKNCKIEQVPHRTKPFDIPLSIGDARKLARDTGWRPRFSLEQTLRALLK